MAVFDKSYDIGFSRMVRYAAHRSSFFEAAVSACKSKLELSGYKNRIVKEHLVEVTKTEHKDRVLVFLLDLKILLHHWREFFLCHLNTPLRLRHMP